MEAAWREKVRVVSEQINASTMRLLRQDASHRLRLLRERVASLDRRLAQSASVQLQSGRAQLRHFEAQLHGLSPLAVLHRGYALVYDESGGLLKSAASARKGETITTRFADRQLDKPGDSYGKGQRNRFMSEDRKLFGTDGIRGVAGEYPLDTKTIFATGVALARLLSAAN